MSEADECEWREQEGVTFADVAHEAALLDDSRIRFNLDQLADDYLNWNVLTDGLGKKPDCIEHEGQFKHLHPGVVAPYALRNAMQVQALDEYFAPRILEEDLTRVQSLERDVIPVVVEFERNGMYLDVDLLEQWHREVREKIDAIKFRIYKDTGLDVTSFDSPKQTAELFRKRGIKSPLLTEGGAESFTDSVLRGFTGDPVINAFREGGQLADLHSKYLDKYSKTVRRDGWIRSNLHQLRTSREEGGKQGTVSGRFSAAGDRQGGYNPQQVVAVEKQLERGWCPDYVARKLFIAAPGWEYLIASDMMQVEYRLFACYADDPQINAAYAADPLADFHAVVMKLLHKLNPTLNRKLVKNVNFALIYGAAIVKFALMLGVIDQATFDELTELLLRARACHDREMSRAVYQDARLRPAQDILDQYHEMFPKVKPLMNRTKKTAETRGYVMDLVGRRARLSNRFHSALNRIIQGGAASINKRVITEVYKQRKSLDFLMQATVHDEIVGSGRLGTKERLDKVLNTQYFDLRVPILWDTKSGNNWAACK
jgi:DNA polymerase I-like protein with 3'-5' exonuclease and polymerase domains